MNLKRQSCTMRLAVLLVLGYYCTCLAQFSKLHDFDDFPDAYRPSGGVALIGSSLFGVTQNGGLHDEGTLWKLDLGSNSHSIIHHFATDEGNAPTGGVVHLNNRTLSCFPRLRWNCRTGKPNLRRCYVTSADNNVLHAKPGLRAEFEVTFVVRAR